jgi:F-box protein 18 (helicase)
MTQDQPSRAQRFRTSVSQAMRPVNAASATSSGLTPQGSSQGGLPASASNPGLRVNPSRAAGLLGALGRANPSQAGSVAGQARGEPSASNQHLNNTPTVRPSDTQAGMRRPTQLGRSASTPPQRVEYSDQQNTIIHSPAKIIVANAFAGTGKTTTAIGYTDHRPHAKILYIAYNKAIQEEASRRFGRNVTCRTAHSLAYAACGRQFGDRIARPWRSLTLHKELGTKNLRQAVAIQGVLNGFFNSADAKIELHHGLEVGKDLLLQEYEVAEAVHMARIAWTRMCNPTDSISVPDDAYLKIWALSRPRLDYEHIIFDECQDANPVLAQVVSAQQHAHLLYIGDRHQSIYGFRGAFNAMDAFDDRAQHLHLSQTWRFGPRIAAVANSLLHEFKGEQVAIEGLGRDAAYVSGSCVTKLSRTNAQLFKEAAHCRGVGVHWVGGASKYQLERMVDAYQLKRGHHNEINDVFLRNFRSWSELESYADVAKDNEARVLVSVIDEFGSEVPELVAQIRQHEERDPQNARLVLTTAHKSKGLDWDYVEIADDFEVLAEAEAELAVDPQASIDEQEINLLYVAVTRAKKECFLNKETQDWLKNLPVHKANRHRALTKAVQRSRAAAIAG